MQTQTFFRFLQDSTHKWAVLFILEVCMEDDERIRKCQREIHRLRSVVRDYANIIEAWSHPDPNDLFGIWGNLDDVVASDKILRVVEEQQLGPKNSISYLAFCHGYEKAVEKLREAV
jgi:hypothetical protein